MQSGSFDVLIPADAKRFYEGLDEADQAEIDRLIGLLQSDPWVDDIHKFVYPSEVVVLTVYDDGRWVILYRLLENHIIHI